ncbi:histidine--tRNA ligase, partial [bacterium]|nr:histidine--tRNA ligase [bacterium]
MEFSRIRGTEDKLDLTLFNFCTQIIEKHLLKNNFSEISTPILEQTKLFARSLGQETDVVSKEMYTIDTKTEGSICLRPEATASVMRAYLENHVDQKPWKVFSTGPMFRHERPQKGRFRQFHQVNIEAIDAHSFLHDVRFIKTLCDIFQDL